MRLRTLLMPIVLCASLWPAASASALTPPVTGTVTVAGPFKLGARNFQLVGEPITVKARVSAFASGQVARIRVTSGGRVLRSATVPIRAAGGGAGSISWRTIFTGAANLRITVSHEATPQLGAFSASGPAVVVYEPGLSFGASGIGVGVLHAMLRRLGFWAPAGTRYGAGTGKAVLAYRKATGMPRVETASRRIYSLLQQGRGAVRARYPQLGEHLEADLSRQILTFFKGSKPVEVHLISSGKPSTPTVLGRYRFYMREPGTNSHGMVDSSYFHNGYAVHGYAELPTWPASHGCLRVWVPLARHIYNRIRLGEWIAVYW